MAKYRTRFSEYTTGAQPSDWTVRWAETAATWAVREKTGTSSGKVLEVDSAADGSHFLSWDDVDADANRADAEIAVRFRTDQLAGFDMGVVVRASGTVGNETCYLVWFHSSFTLCALYKFVGGIATSLGTFNPGISAAGPNVWWNARVRVVGSTQKVRVWANGAAEPSTWNIEASDTSISAAGWVGVCHYEAGSTVDFDTVAIATNGDTADLFTTLYTEFDGYTLDAQPTGWTARWNTTSSSWAVRSVAAAGAGRILEHTSSADGFRLLSIDALDADAGRVNVELIGRVRTRNAGVSSQLHQATLVARGSGASGSETGYMLSFSSSIAGGIRLRKRVAGVTTDLGAEHTDSFVWTAETWYLMRFRVNGSNLYGKIWQDGTPEPSGWQITATDSSISAAGWIGVGNFESTGTTRDFDYVGVGIDGDAAPLHTLSSTVSKVHALAVETLYAPAARGQLHQLVAEVAIGAVVPGHLHQMVVEVLYAPGPAEETQQPRMNICF